MKNFLFLMVLLPLIGSAQINRSAKELASEKIKSYLTEKLFKKAGYQVVSFGELKRAKDNDCLVAWTLEHTFSISEAQEESEAGSRESIAGSHIYPGGEFQRTYRFIFYLDRKMTVKRAETFLD